MKHTEIRAGRIYVNHDGTRARLVLPCDLAVHGFGKVLYDGFKQDSRGRWLPAQERQSSLVDPGVRNRALITTHGFARWAHREATEDEVGRIGRV